MEARGSLNLLLLLLATVGLSTPNRNQKTVEQVFVASRVSFQGWNHQPLSLPNYDVEPDPKFDSRTSQMISRNVLQLAQDIGRSLLKNSNKKSEVFSPLSIYGAMSLLLMGASGPTYHELMNVLRFGQDPYLSANPWKIHEEFGLMIEDIDKDFVNPRHKRPFYYWQINRQHLAHDIAVPRRVPDEIFPQKISVANGIFVQNGYSIRPDYQDAVQGVYHSSLRNLDFAHRPREATKFINDWVDEKTNGRIRSIISDSLSPDTKVIMASALYFKATWERKFIEGATQPRSFYPDGLDQPPITVEMMAHGGAFPFYEAREYDCRILALPYQKNLTTMYIIVPNNSNRQRLQQFQAQLTADKIEDMISKMEWKTVILLFPKIHVENQLDLVNVLHQMGVSSLFDKSRSDLSLISTGEELLNTWLPNIPNGNSIANAFVPVINHNQYGHPARYPDAEREQNDSPFLFSSRFGDEDESENGTITTKTPESTKILATLPPKAKEENLTVTTTEVPMTTQESTSRSTTSTTTTTTATTTTQPPATITGGSKLNITTTTAPITTVASKHNVTTTPESITTTEADDDVKTTIMPTTQEPPTKRAKRSVVKYKAPSEFHPAQEPLRLKDFVLGKRITKSYPRKKHISRGRRQISPWLNDPSFSLKNLDVLRTGAIANRLVNPGLFVDKIIHKIDLTINEKGTEGGAATVTVLRRSGTDVVMRVETPFMFLIRHDDTRLPLFYGTVYEPTNF